MGSGSRTARARSSLPTGLWVLAALPVLCVASYPVTALAQVMPRAGLVSIVLITGFLVMAAYGTQRDPRLLSLGAGCVWTVWASALVGVAAWLGDGAGWEGVLDFIAVTDLAMFFSYHLLFWLVSDLAPDVVPARAGFEPVPRAGKPALSPQSGLALVLLLGILLLGLGAVWARAEEWVPAPTYWVVALLFFCFALMFAERLRFFGRSARDGNLLLALRAREKWIAAGLLVLLAAALVAAAFPWNPPPPEPSQNPPGSKVDTAPAPPGAVETLAQDLDQRAQSLAGSAVAAFAAAPRVFTLLWLLLFLLVVAAVLVWVFSRTRAARWVLAVVMTFLEWCLHRWSRLVAWFARLFARGGRAGVAEAAQEEPWLASDPLFDVFEDSEALSRLSAREIAIHTYHLLLNFAEMLGHGRRPGQTPFEYGQVLTRAVPAAEHALAALTWGYSAAMYGAEDTSLPPASAVRDSWARISEALVVGVSAEELALRRQAYLATRAVQRRS